jgi:acetylornithine deacetylase/succinyl-diaminopimelate desuccinylase-like protein
MTSLAAVHTAAALLVRALGDAGVSNDVRLEYDAHDGIKVYPARGCTTVDWATAVLAVAEVSQANGSHLFCTGHVDTVPVTASWWALEVAG